MKYAAAARFCHRVEKRGTGGGLCTEQRGLIVSSGLWVGKRGSVTLILIQQNDQRPLKKLNGDSASQTHALVAATISAAIRAHVCVYMLA
jgi:hypothetical protein